MTNIPQYTPLLPHQLAERDLAWINLVRDNLQEHSLRTLGKLEKLHQSHATLTDELKASRAEYAVAVSDIWNITAERDRLREALEDAQACRIALEMKCESLNVPLPQSLLKQMSDSDASSCVALSAIPAPDGVWQPIETAPKQRGRYVLGYSPDNLCVVVVCWWTTPERPDGFWSEMHDTYNADSNPTHWQPVPTPPAAIAAKDKL